MHSIARADSRVQPPHWRKLLHRRGLDDATIDALGIRYHRRGWKYPASPANHARRWKAFPNQNGAKYLWLPAKPDTVTIYDPTGTLADHVAAAGANLILASGEPDVWALHAAGIRHATCTMLGEGSIPAWLVEELRRLRVRRVLVYPDRDAAGDKHAAKLAAVLAGTGIQVSIYTLPADQDSHYDLNALWLDCAQDRERFSAALVDCTVWQPPATLAKSTQKPVQQSASAPAPSDDTTGLLEVERRTRLEIARMLVKRGGKPDVYECPLEHGSAGKDFLFSAEPNSPIGGCMGKHRGELTRWTDLAAHLEIDVSQIARDVARDRARARSSRPATAPVQTYVEFFPGEDLNYYPSGIPRLTVELLMGLHKNPWTHVERNDIPNGGAFVALWYRWHALVLTGQRDPAAAFTIPAIAHETGLTDATVRSALRFNELFEFLIPYCGANSRGQETQINSRGRPAQHYIFRSLRAIWSHFMEVVEPLLWRALLVTDYPDLPAEALALADLLERECGATLDDIAAIDDRSHALYVAHADAYREANRHWRWRLNKWRWAYIAAADTSPLDLPETAQFTNAAQFRDAINLAYMPEAGARKNRYAMADLTGRTMTAHRASCERLGIATVPEYTHYPVNPDGDIVTQAETLNQVAYVRGRIDLLAPNGRELALSVGYSPEFNYDAWLGSNGGRAGAQFQVWERSIEQREAELSDYQRAKRDDISRRQRAISQNAARRDQQAEPAPSPLETWLVRQGEMRASLFGLQVEMSAAGPVYVSPAGEVFDPGTVWVGIVVSVRRGAGSDPSDPAPVSDGGPVASHPGHGDPATPRGP